LDTGANQHVTLDLANLTDSAPYLGNDHLHIGDGKGLSISHIGHTMLRSSKHTFTLSNVHVPHITKPLLSIHKFYRDNNVYFEFHASVFYVKDFTSKAVLLFGQSNDGLYVLSKSSTTTIPQAYWSPCISASADLWHRRLGHPTSCIFNMLVFKNKIMCTSRCSLIQCQAYPLGKTLRLLLRPTSHKTTAPLDLIFSDVWGPAPMFSNGFRYFVIFIDTHTKNIWYFLLVAKSDVFSIFQHFQVLVECQFSRKIKSVQIIS
jgi:histone deacetylase 1/2